MTIKGVFYNDATGKLHTGAAGGVSEATGTVLGTVKKNRYQKKTAGTQSVGASNIITFSNLTIGVVYKATFGAGRFTTGVADGTASVSLVHDGNLVGTSVGILNQGGVTDGPFSIGAVSQVQIFTATTTTLSMDSSLASTQVLAPFVILEEMNTMEVTTAWT